MRRATLALVAVVAALVAAPARADEGAARAAFKQGVELYDAQRWAEALQAFELAYREKPSPVLWQNIGLCHRRLDHLVAAAAAFDRALDEGAAVLKDDTKAAITRELRELELRVATVRLRVIDREGRAVDFAHVAVDGTELDARALRRPVRLEPGTHVITARAEGFGEPPAKKLALEQGSPVDATFELEPAPSPPLLPPVIEHVPARDAEAPAPYLAPSRRASPGPKRFVLGVTLGASGQSLRLGEGSGEAPGGARRPFAGGALGVRGGVLLGRFASLELRGEIGSQSASYAPSAGTPRETKAEVSHVALTPGVRFATAGTVRFTAGSGLGLHATTVTVEIPRQSGAAAGTERRRGSGLAGSWVLDAGVQLDVGPVALEIVGTGEVHGVSNARDDVVFDRMLLASPSVRYGGRVGLLIPF